MTLERIQRDRQKRYNERLVANIYKSGRPMLIMRMFRYRMMQERDGVITRKSLFAEFGKIGESTLKKYLSELEAINENKPRSYKLSHRAKLDLSVIEL